MDTNENKDRIMPPAKVRKSHVIMLILSCVFLFIALKGAGDLLEVFLLPESPSYPSDAGSGGLFAILLGEWLQGAALAVLLFGFVPYLCGGLALSIVLASRRRDKPAWLWGLSLGLVVLFGLIAAGLIAAWILL